MKDFIDEFYTLLLKNKSNIFKLFSAFYSFICILYLFGLNGSYNFFVVFILIGIFILFFKVKINLKYKKISLFSSLICSFLVSLGNLVSNSLGVTLHIFTIRSLLRILVLFGGVFIFLYYIFNMLFNWVKNINVLVSGNRKAGNKIFLVSFVIILLLWIPYYLRFFPGILSYDSIVQLNCIEKGIFMNHHPFVQTWFEGGIYYLGKLIFKSNTLAMGFYTFIQMMILALIFAYSIKFLYKRKFNSIIVVLVLLIYGLLPQFAIYSVTIWKDILFGGFMLLLLITCADMSLDKIINKSSIVLFTISCLIILFFRNNGIYMLLLCLPFFIYCFKDKVKSIKFILPILIVFYFIITGPVYNLIGVQKSSSVEMFAIPMQQIARVIASSEKIDKHDEKYLKKIFMFKEIKKLYQPYIVDPVKNHSNKDYLDKTKIEFCKVWFSLAVKHPIIYTEAYLSHTLGYWYPSVKYWTTVSPDVKNNYNITNKNLMPSLFSKYVDYIRSLNFVMAQFFWGIGLGFILLFVSINISIVRGVSKDKYLAWYVPYIDLWLTMMVGSPVFAEYRYVFGLFTSLPIILLLPFILKNKKNN